MTLTIDPATAVFAVDHSRCIGCGCDTHRGVSMIHLDTVDRAASTQTVPQVCMHCEDPTCAEVCPADAIKQNEDGVVQSSLKPRCIACSNCVYACPFGIPKMVTEYEQMMKCDMCYDRTSEGLKPMCASVCPSEALWYGTRDEFERTRRGTLVRDWQFGNQDVRTKVAIVANEPGTVDVYIGKKSGHWLDDPFALATSR
jgi:Fe-S-cluster-containing dehydrogenase component